MTVAYGSGLQRVVQCILSPSLPGAGELQATSGAQEEQQAKYNVRTAISTNGQPASETKH